MTQGTRYGALAVRTYRALIDPMLVPLRPKIVRICRELGLHEILDIATATGAQCRALGQAGIRATGVDLSEEMVSAAQRTGGRNVHYVHGSAYELPFEDASFDASLLLLALHEHTEEERTVMLSEALRVIRPEGHLIVADYARPRCSAVHAAWQLIRLIEHVAGPEHRSGFKDFMATGGVEGFLDRHGLAINRRTRSHFGAIAIAVAECA
jgi:SAM-dependent methyltransferase